MLFYSQALVCPMKKVMSINLPPRYNPQQTESKIYKEWEKTGYFNPDKLPAARKRKPFTIIMPPPNANGALHIGHAVFVTLQDIMIRYQRMRGKRSLWVPGADHAGFETQVVFDKKLEKEGRSRFKIPRAKLYKEILSFTLKNKKIMEKQLKQLGASCDWTREKFTLDKDIINTVYSTFFALYQDGLIYRDNRIVNWCPKHQTTLSDLEVKYIERRDPLYYIKYGPLTLATVRPETKFGDTAVAVHPKDKRYKHLIGKEIEIKTLLGKTKIKVIADSFVDPKFGTGVVKITPAHDPDDFEVWKRHKNEIPGPRVVIDKYGRLDLLSHWPDNQSAQKYHGLKVARAREIVAQDMQNQGLIEKVIPDYTHIVAVCYKCSTILEPRILPQWYVAMTKKPASKKYSLRDAALEAVRKRKVVFLPARMEKIFIHWMKNIRDWNISRQIVWGIRIPAWYCQCQPENKKTHIGLTPPARKCPKCHKPWQQDEDVFDTWFSSGQWPFAILGYPKGKDYQIFYPTDVMETGHDILFFWVARMIMLGLYCTGKPPFKTVYLHGLVRDKDRQKMSKSKGNVIDPLAVTQTYGTDALRMALVIGNLPGNDIIISEEKIKGYRNFANKLWNINRFIYMHYDSKLDKLQPKFSKKQISWRKELKELIRQTTKNMEKFRFHHAAQQLYHYTWHTFADKIIEESKPALESKDLQEKAAAQQLLMEINTALLKMLHPFMPFITEKLWSYLPQKQKMLIIERWPTVSQI